MKKWKVRSALVALIVLLAGCSSNAQYNSSASGNVGTAWGGDVHSTVQGVSAERAWRDPAEMIVIIRLMFLPATTAFIAFVLTNWNMLFAMVILILYLLRVFMIHPIMNHAILSTPESE